MFVLVKSFRFFAPLSSYNNLTIGYINSTNYIRDYNMDVIVILYIPKRMAKCCMCVWGSLEMSDRLFVIIWTSVWRNFGAEGRAVPGYWSAMAYRCVMMISSSISSFSSSSSGSCLAASAPIAGSSAMAFRRRACRTQGICLIFFSLKTKTEIQLNPV